MSFNWLKASVFLVLTSIGLVACTTSNQTFSPEEIIQQTIAESDKIISYYGESVMTIEDVDFSDTIEIKEWQSKEGKRRTETVSVNSTGKATSVNDGSQIISYDESSNTAYRIDLSGENMLPQMSPREQAQMLLEAIKDTHTVSLIGEEKLLDRDVYHLKAEVKEENSLYPNQEIWIDKENWFVLKSISDGSDTKVTIEYKNIDFDFPIDDSLFVLELPEGVIAQDMAETMEKRELKSLEEAILLMEKPFLYAEEKDGLVIEQMSTVIIEGNDPELSMRYFKDHLPYFTLNLFPVTEENKPFANEGINIRGLQGEKMDVEDFRVLLWAEDGYGYSVILDNPELTFEEMLQIIEEMKHVEM